FVMRRRGARSTISPYTTLFRSNRIGMMGFSAGAGLTMHSTLNSDSMKLAFIAPIYGGMQAVEVPENAPPLFAVIASDDFLFRGQDRKSTRLNSSHVKISYAVFC